MLFASDYHFVWDAFDMIRHAKSTHDDKYPGKE